MAIFKEHRDSILRFVQKRRSVVARDREESALKQGLCFLHHNVDQNQVAEPMEVVPMYSLVAKLFSRKIAADIRRADGGREPPVNIMRVTRVFLGAPSAGPSSEIGLRIAQLVKGVQANGPACPRLQVFGILAGMDDKSPWLEPSSLRRHSSRGSSKVCGGIRICWPTLRGATSSRGRT